MDAATTPSLSKRRRVLICFAPPTFQRVAFDWARDNLLRRGQDHVGLLTVIPVEGGGIFDLYRSMMMDEHGEFLAQEHNMVDQSETILHKFQHELVPLNLTSQALVIRDKDVKSALVKACTDFHADILVMAAHGKPNLRKKLLGGVSDYCVNNSPCPVLVVRTPVEVEDAEAAEQKQRELEEERQAKKAEEEAERMEREATVSKAV